MSDALDVWADAPSDAPSDARSDARPDAGPRAPAVPRPALVEPPAGGPLAHLDRWRRDPRVTVVALLAFAVLAGAVWFRLSVSGAGAPAADPDAAASAASGTAGAPGASTGVPDGEAPVAPAAGGTPAVAGESGPAPPAAAATVVVHVAGAVRAPGVVTLPAGARVVDAVEAAGGPRPRADLDRLNLAAVLTDGQRVLVARRGDPPTPPLPGDATTSAPAPAPGAALAPVDVNTAGIAELEALPGIGPALARAIVEERARRGGFASVDELLAVPGIGDARLADLRPHVTV
jgi:competence protein ComEA